MSTSDRKPHIVSRSKLTVAQRQQIAAQRAAGATLSQLAAEYGVSTTTIAVTASLYQPENTRTDSFSWLGRQAMHPGGAAR